MKTPRPVVPHLLIVVGLVTLSCPGSGAAQSIWPERSENLQVLPEDTPAERLRAVMVGFTRSLGVRCSHCHVGEEGRPLSTFDFPSDENPNKDRARAMLRMLATIEDELGGMELRPDVKRVEVGCHTCHAGKPRPVTLGESVTAVLEKEGGEAALRHFVELRERYYGGPAFDFRPPSVNELAAGILQRGDTATAVAFFELNVELHPAYAEGWESLGDVAAVRGRTDEAVRLYERALELAPGHPRISAKLRDLGGG